jgi:hypothetical protein
MSSSFVWYPESVSIPNESVVLVDCYSVVSQRRILRPKYAT